MQINNRKPKKPVMNIVLRIVISGVILAAGAAVMVALASMKTPPVEKRPPERALQVTVLEVAPEDVSVTITGYGEVKSLNVVTLSPEVAGRVVEVHPRLEPGEVIEAGELLFKIDPRDYAAAADQSRAAVSQLRQSINLLEKQKTIDTRRLKTLERNGELAKDEFTRLKQLYESDKVGTRSGVEAAEQRYNTAADQAAIMARALSLYPIQISEAKSSLAAARSRQEVAATNLARCEVRAPFKARLKMSAIEANQYVTPGMPALTLANDQTLEIQVPLDSRDARRWLIFQGGGSPRDSAWFGALKPVACRIRWSEDPGGSGWEGRLHRVVKFDQETRTVTVAVRIGAGETDPIDGRGLPLVEGMFCAVEIPGQDLHGVFRLPRWAVSFKNTVFVSRDGRLKTVPVTVVRLEGEQAFVSEGLDAGDQVVTTRLIDPLENTLLNIKPAEMEAPPVMKQILTAFAKNTVFANILLLLIFVAGTMAVKLMLRENFPEFSLDMITISVAYPGADPEEVEEGICRKIEEVLEGMEGIKQYTTKSSENVGTAVVEVKEDYEVDEVLDRVRSKVGAISTFPVDAEEPVITELTVKDPVILLYLSGDMTERRIKEAAERIKDDIQQIPMVSQVTVTGTRDYEIAIEVSEARLREYGLTFKQLSDAIRKSNLNLGGGTIRTQGEEIRVRTMGRKYTGEALASIVVVARPDGEIITLDRLAHIDDGFVEDPTYATINGEPSVLLIVFKTKEEDALAISKAVNAYIEEKQAQIPAGVNFGVLYDNTGMLRDRINLLVKNGAIGLSLVFLLLWAFLNTRLSFWAGMGIPVSIAGALGLLWFMGETINMISLFGLIMVLGIVVDDAIVVGEAIYVHRQNGEGPLRAAVEGVYEVGMPVVAAVTTSVVAFIPLFFVGGIMGKFISILPLVVIACLLFSLVECLFLLPAHLSHLPDPNRAERSRNVLIRLADGLHDLTSRGLEWFVARVYRPFLSRVLNWRYITLSSAIAILLASVGMVAGGILKFQVFPEIDGFVITSTVEFPSGTPPEVTRQAVNQIDQALIRLGEKTETLSGEPMVNQRLAIVGATLSEPPRSGPQLGAVQAIMLDSERRGVHTQDLMVAWEKEIGPIPGAIALTFEGMQAGPPGAPIEVWLQGHHMPDILAAADQLMERLRQFEGVYQIRSDFSPGKNELRLELKPEARTLGLTVDDLARQVYAGYYGEEAVRLQRGRDDIRVKVRYSADERSRLSELDQVRIRTREGRTVPLNSVAEVYFSPGYSTITRTDGMRRVSVSANVDSNKANASEIFAELSGGFFQGLMARYPGLYVALQGEQKKMRESFETLFVGYPLAVLGIFIIVATIFRSYAQPFIILFTIPFGVIGSIYGHLLLGFNLSIMSIFGMVALTGVVVNDAIVLIERVNENLAQGMRFFEAILNGGSRRFRAIFLTTLSTVGGLTPLIMEQNFQARFMIPMAISLAAGVAFATLLTLILIPSLLVIMNDFRLLAWRFKKGAWPTREEVEPARDRHVDPLAGGVVKTGKDASVPEVQEG